MKRFIEIFKRYTTETPGNIASVSFLLCALSGAFLAIPFDSARPYDSVSVILLDNPAAAYIRNIHYWTAQFFLVFTILHLVEHLINQSEFQVRRGVWFRLVVSLPVILFVMISGFILKGDADAISAFSILSSLTDKIPLAGGLLRDSFLGGAGDYQIIYVHHIATATIFLLLILMEHTRSSWPRMASFLVLSFIFLLISYFFQAPFGTDTGKGPWYFTGLQEMLHWMSRPGWVWLILPGLLILFWLLPRLGNSANSRCKHALGLAALFYLGVTLFGIWFRGEGWKAVWPWERETGTGTGLIFAPLPLQSPESYGFGQPVPLIMGQREGCLVCHHQTAGFSPAHDPLALGCYSCHGGNPFTLDKRRAHRNMRLIPGNLADAATSCGTAQCHPDITHRVPRSIMSTMSGVVTVDRWVFGEEDSLNALAHIAHIGYSAADRHLRDLCANCHLGNPKTASGPVTQLSRGGGCNACHLNYDDRSLSSRAQYLASGSLSLTDTFHHPRLSLDVRDDHCFGCHSRSGRIATNYQGWHETLLDSAEMPGDGRHRLLEDKRVFTFAGADVHHEKGLQCIDCHHSRELMGDGNLYPHKEDQVTIGCADCHLTKAPQTTGLDGLDDESLKIIALRQWNLENKRLIRTDDRGHALVNTWIAPDGTAWQKIKSTGAEVALKPPVVVCRRAGGHESLGCESCHTAWVPTCIGCHNAYDRDAPGYDMLEGKDRKGSWVEYVGSFMFGPPALGIVENTTGRQVKTFTPGMILSIDTASFRGLPAQSEKEEIFRRLYAPVSAHTTVRQGRSCTSCHNDPVALGYGQGQLVFEMVDGSGRWRFTPRFAPNRFDGLPEDAWIGFLTEPRGALSTRLDARPFTLEEQRKILAVGACLTCHPQDSEVMASTLDDFEAVRRRMTPRCVAPRWD